jgi:hypothetical protein
MAFAERGLDIVLRVNQIFQLRVEWLTTFNTSNARWTCFRVAAQITLILHLPLWRNPSAHC